MTTGPDDHPFLRAHAGMANLSLQEGRGGGAGPVVQTRPTTEEEDMAYFERRYQERVSENEPTRYKDN